MIANTKLLSIDGVSEFATQLPDNEWYCMRIYLRKEDIGASIVVDNDINVVDSDRVLAANC